MAKDTNTVSVEKAENSVDQLLFEDLGRVSEATQTTKLYIGFEQEDPYIYYGRLSGIDSE